MNEQELRISESDVALPSLVCSPRRSRTSIYMATVAARPVLVHVEVHEILVWAFTLMVVSTVASPSKVTSILMMPHIRPM